MFIGINIRGVIQTINMK